MAEGETTAIFFYGSLRDRELTEIVLGRAVADTALVRASAPGHATRRLAGLAYPMLRPLAGARAEGVALLGASEADLDRLCFFEEAEYGLAPITIETEAGPVEAQYFLATDKPTTTDLPWDYAAWAKNDRAVALEAARELMLYHDSLAIEDVDTVWPGIMVRARQRARAKAEALPPKGITSGLGREAVEVERIAHPYTGFLKVEEYRLRHRRFDGSWSAPVNRTAVLWGDAVTMLPYDPATDRVLLIEQFRIPAFARGAPNPWCIEVVAGLLDGDDDPEATARREAIEEAGVEIGRTREIGRYYTSSGLAAEFIVSFLGEADLSQAGGVHGLAVENEDIRSIVLPLDDALAAAASGAVNTGPALASLLWLAAHRGEVRTAWGLRRTG
ncbi:MAG: NUDIX domain-containing protein [Pseudomonadota bacterium]